VEFTDDEAPLDLPPAYELNVPADANAPVLKLTPKGLLSAIKFVGLYFLFLL